MANNLYIVNKITKAAEETFEEPVTAANYAAWEEHWFKVAQAFKRAFQKEGLTETTLAVDAIISFFAEHSRGRFDSQGNLNIKPLDI